MNKPNYEFQFGEHYGDILTVMIRAEKNGKVLMKGIGKTEIPLSEEEIRQAKETLIKWVDDHE